MKTSDVLARIAIAGLAASALSACATYEDPGPIETISIPYDPYDYNPSAMDAEAQAHCEAFGLDAVFVDETADIQAVRWRYRNYDCV